MDNLVILGSTGSIGQSGLDVARRLRRELRVLALSAGANTGLLLRQAREFRPRYICVADAAAAQRIRPRLARGVKLFCGEKGPCEMLEAAGECRVLLAISGAAALMPLLKALQLRQTVCLANKEALVMAGGLVMAQARKNKTAILPVDSEQSAIWQCLRAAEGAQLRQVYLTASGGPLRNASRKALSRVSPRRVLRHPRWKMGRKITVDSATMMNKGLELLEAMALFGLPAEKIKVLIHPESVVHSMVELIDGSILAQLSATDMRVPIQYALTYPRRLRAPVAGVDFYKLKALHFEKPDEKKFPCLKLAYQAARQSGTLPAVMNAANEIAVEGFLRARLCFTGIADTVARVMARHRNVRNPALGDILYADSWARRTAELKIQGRG
jgi:1-deoxy-D-xylulose-5-phosphate reductoisomerase